MPLTEAEYTEIGARRDPREQLIGWSLSIGFAAVINWVAFGPALLTFPGSLFVGAIAVALDLLLLFVLMWEVLRRRHAGGAAMAPLAPRRARSAPASTRRWVVIVSPVGVAGTAANLAVLAKAMSACPACGLVSAAGIWLFWVGASAAPIALGLALVTRAPHAVTGGSTAASSSARGDWSFRLFTEAAALAVRISRVLDAVAVFLGVLAALGLACMIAVLAAGYLS